MISTLSPIWHLLFGLQLYGLDESTFKMLQSVKASNKKKLLIQSEKMEFFPPRQKVYFAEKNIS